MMKSLLAIAAVTLVLASAADAFAGDGRLGALARRSRLDRVARHSLRSDGAAPSPLRDPERVLHRLLCLRALDRRAEDAVHLPLIVVGSSAILGRAVVAGVRRRAHLRPLTCLKAVNLPDP
jgi:hypothetical protein